MKRSRIIVARVACLLALAGASASSLLADEQTDRLDALERRIAALEEALRRALPETGEDAKELKRRLEMLSKELEKARIGDAASPTPASVHGLGPAASKVYGVEAGVSIGGYGEGLYQDFDATRDNGARTGKASEADFLRGVLYFGWKFSDRIVFNSEIEFEHASTGEGGEASVEFATIDFLLNAPVNVRAGLLLIPVGFINEMHEPPTFLGARRPDVERNILPATWRENGAGLFGEAGPFSYRAYLVNGLDASGFTAGSGLRSGRQDGSEAKARDVALATRLDYRGIPGLTTGVSWYTGESGQGADDAAGTVIGARVSLYDLHAEYRLRGLQARGLWAAVTLDQAAEVSAKWGQVMGARMNGWYLEAGYDLLAFQGEKTRQALTPFVRYERYDTQDRVASGLVTTGVNDVKVVTVGAAWKPIFNLSVKAEWQDFDRADGSGADQINVAIGYLF